MIEITRILTELITHFPKPNHFARKKGLFLPREASAGDAAGACTGDILGLPSMQTQRISRLTRIEK